MANRNKSNTPAVKIEKEQLAFSVPTALAAKIKARAACAGTSMTEVFIERAKEYGNAPKDVILADFKAKQERELKELMEAIG